MYFGSAQPQESLWGTNTGHNAPALVQLIDSLQSQLPFQRRDPPFHTCGPISSELAALMKRVTECKPRRKSSLS